jgi:hypothetical protein
MTRDQSEGKIVTRLTLVRRRKAADKGLTALWVEMDRLAETVTAKWSGTKSAVDAVRESRREL